MATIKQRKSKFSVITGMWIIQAKESRSGIH